MANIANTYDPNAEATSTFEPVPAGEYRANIIEAEIEDVSKRDNKGRCLKLTWKLETGPYDGRLIWQRLNLWAENMNNLDKVINIANSQFAAIREATGRSAPQDTDELLHIPCIIKLSVRHDPSGQYEPQNEVRSVKSVSGSVSRNTPSAAFASQTNAGASTSRPWGKPA